MSDLEVFDAVGPADDSYEVHVINNHQTLRTHRIDECEGHACAIHAPSEHGMRGMVRWWRPDRGIIERICNHGVGHPDPDDVAFHARHGRNISVHGCDGCCRA